MRVEISIEQEIAALRDLPYPELCQLWTRQYGTPPPKGARRLLLERSASYWLQVKRFGGLSPVARRALKAAMAEVEAKARARVAPTTGKPQRV